MKCTLDKNYRWAECCLTCKHSICPEDNEAYDDLYCLHFQEEDGRYMYTPSCHVCDDWEECIDGV